MRRTLTYQVIRSPPIQCGYAPIDILMISEGLDYVTEEARSAVLRLWFDIRSAPELGRQLIKDLDLWRFRTLLPPVVRTRRVRDAPQCAALVGVVL
jgi:hypothetical protein